MSIIVTTAKEDADKATLKELLDQYNENSFYAGRSAPDNYRKARKAELEEKISALFESAGEAGARREREECAWLAENEIRAWERINSDPAKEPSIETARVIARAIRARGEDKK